MSSSAERHVPVADSSQRISFENLPSLCLEICRGRTKFPQRPISTDRFLIGSGEHCDLRLGGDKTPILHSMIRFENDELLLEAFAFTPPLQVNGQVKECVVIHEGDHIEIGSFAFVVRRTTTPSQHQTERIKRPEEPSILKSNTDFELDPDVSELTVAVSELVELLEKDQELVDQFEARRNLGAKALIQTVEARTSSHKQISDRQFLQPVKASNRTIRTPRDNLTTLQQIASLPQTPGSESLKDLESVLQQLNLFPGELERRAQRLSHREASYSEAAELLLDVQKKLATQLLSLSEQVQMLQERDTRSCQPTRVIA